MSGSADRQPPELAQGRQRSSVAIVRLYIGLGAATLALFAILAAAAGIGPAS